MIPCWYLIEFTFIFEVINNVNLKYLHDVEPFWMLYLYQIFFSKWGSQLFQEPFYNLNRWLLNECTLHFICKVFIKIWTLNPKPYTMLNWHTNGLNDEMRLKWFHMGFVFPIPRLLLLKIVSSSGLK